MSTAAAQPASTATTPVQAADEGPYLGLRSYEEADADRYFGREDIVAEVARMVRRAPLTVVFGVSGTGKTSLIRAGVFPVLREEQFLPILIRFGFERPHPDLRAQVRAAICAEIEAHHIDAPPPGDGEPLHDYFARNPFWSPTNQLLTPLLVFDQFEEIFTIGRDRAAQVEVLIDDLAAMIERVPRAIEAEGIVAPRPGMMIVLREDFLAHLEDYRPKLPSLASNRYRLTRMNGEQALRAVMRPAGALIDEATATRIVQFVAGGADSVDPLKDPRPLDTLEIEPAILSLVCQQLELQRRKLGLPQITEALIQSQGGRIVERFYDAAFTGLPAEVRALVEDHLVTSDGYRTTMAKAAALETAGVTAAAIQKLLADKILREEVRFGSLHIELIHDRLTRTAREGRARRREEAREKAREQLWRRQLGIVLGAVALVVLGVIAASVLYARAQRRRAEQAQRLAEKQQAAERLKELASLLIRDGRDALLRGDATRAATRLQQASAYLEQSGAVKPPETGLLYKRALVDLVGRIQTIDHGSEIDHVRVRGDDELLTCGRDGTVRVWRNSRVESDSRDADTGPVLACQPDHQGDWILMLHADGSGQVRTVSGKTRTVVSFEAPAVASQAAPPSAAPQTSTSALVTPTAASAVGAASQSSRGPATRLHWHGCIAPDDSAFAVWADETPGVRGWTMPTGERIQSAWLDRVTPIDVRCLPGARLAVSGGVKRLAYVGGARPTAVTGVEDVAVVAPGGALKRTVPAYELTFAIGLAASDTGEVLAIAYVDSLGFEGVRVFKNSGTQLGEHIQTPRPRHIELSADGEQLLVTSELADHRTFIGIWNTRSRELRFAIDRPAGSAQLVTSSRGTYLFVASDRRVEGWDVKDGHSIGSAMFDLDLDGAQLDVRDTPSGFVVAATARSMASLRRLEAPAGWADRELLPAAAGAEQWAVRMLADVPGTDQRSLIPGALGVRGPDQRDVARLDDARSEIVDARTAPAIAEHGHARIAVLCNTGVVTLYDERFAEIRARVGEMPVHAIRWSPAQDLITLGWRQTQIWTADGEAVATIDAAADDAMLIDTPMRILWTCAPGACTAWDPATQERLASLRTDGIHPAQLARVPGGHVAVLDGDRGARLLPLLGRGDRAVRPVRDLAVFDGRLIVTGEDRIGYQIQADGALGSVARGPWLPAPTTGQLIAADGNAVLRGSLLDLAAHKARPLWSASAPVVALSLRDRQLGVIDQALGLTLLDIDKLDLHDPGAVLARAPGDLHRPAIHAVFSASGDRYGFLDARGQIEVHMTASGAFDSRYDAANLAVRALSIAGAKSPVVAALTDQGLAIWNASSKNPVLRSTPYRRVVMDGAGKHLAALRLDNTAELLEVDAVTGTAKLVKTIPACDVEIDDAGTQLVANDGKGAVNLYNLKDYTQEHRWPANRPTCSPSRHTLRFSHGGRYLWARDLERHDSGIIRVSDRSKDTGVFPTPHDCVFSERDFAVCFYEKPEKTDVVAFQLPDSNEPRAKSASGISIPLAPELTFGCTGVADDRIAIGMSIGDDTVILIWNRKAPGNRPQQIRTPSVVACRLDGESLWTLTDAGQLQRWNASSSVVESRGGARLLDALLVAGGELLAAFAVPRHGILVRSMTTTATAATALASDGDAEFAVFAGERELVAAIAATDGPRLVAWPLPLRSEVKRVLEPAITTASRRPAVTALVRLGSEPILAAGFADGAVQLWKPAEVKPSTVLPGYGSPARHIIVDDVQRWIATSYDDGTVSLWELHPTDPQAGREPLIRLNVRGRTPGAPAIVFAGAGPAALITGSTDGQIKRWTLGGEIPPDAGALIRRALDEVVYGIR